MTGVGVWPRGHDWTPKHTMKKTPNLRYGMTGRRKKLWHIPRENQGLNEGSRLNCYTKPLVKKWADPLCFTMFTTGNFMNFVAQETDSYWFLYNSLQPPQKTHPKSTSRYLGSCERLDQVKGLGWSDDDDVEVLLKNLGRCFAKKKEKNQKHHIRDTYIYIHKYPPPFVGEFHHWSWIRIHLMWKEAKSPPGLWHLTPHLTPTPSLCHTSDFYHRTCSRNILLCCPKTRWFFIRLSTKALGIPPFFERSWKNPWTPRCTTPIQPNPRFYPLPK